MATQVWRGAAKAVAQVTSVTPANIEPGDVFTLSINRKDIAVTVPGTIDPANQAAAIANVVSQFIALIGQYNNAEPEWAEISASAGVDQYGVTTSLRLTGPTNGKPFTVTATTSDGAFTINVTVLTEGQPAVQEIQRIRWPVTPTAGTFLLTFDQQLTGAIAYNASPATVQTALQALSSIGAGGATVTGVATEYYDVQFSAAISARLPGLIRVDDTAMTNMASVTVVTESDFEDGSVVVVTTSDTSTVDDWRLVLTEVSGRKTTTGWISYAASQQQVVEALYAVGISAIVTASTTNGVRSWRIVLQETAKELSSVQIDSQTSAGEITFSTSEYTAAIDTARAEVQYLIANGLHTFTITLEGETTAGINLSPVGSAAAAIKAALEALTVVGTCTVTLEASGTSLSTRGATWKVVFAEARDLSQMTTTITSRATVTLPTVITAAQVAANEVQRIAISGTPTGGTFTVTFGANTTAAQAYNVSAATLESALTGLASIGAGNAKVTGPAGGPWLVTFQGTLAATNVALMSANGASLTGAIAQTFTTGAVTSATGPNNLGDANNWYNPAAPTTAALPIAGDTIIFRDSAVDALWNLEALAGLTFAALYIDASYTGRIGLPRYNGQYYEYLPRRLRLGSTLVFVGQGNGNGSSRIKLDMQAVATTILVYQTGTSEDDAEALTITGTNAANVVRILKGSVGIGTEEPLDAPVVATLNIGYVSSVLDDVQARVFNATVTTVVKNGGTLLMNSGATTITHRAGSLVLDTSSTVTTLNQDGGDLAINGSGTITTLNVYTGSVASAAGNAPGCTVTNTNIYGGSTLLDPFRRITFTNPIALIKCGIEDVSLQIGKDITLVRA